MLFVVIRTGADPTFDGGGELALDIEADVMEALSEIISLDGVPGRSCLETDTRLDCREGSTLGGNIEVTDEGVALPAGGISVFGVDVRRKVFGADRVNGD
tara:strand:- start:272 stop:571 length:300 start_codon:yes stop_codon:yes gene_type:complete